MKTCAKCGEPKYKREFPPTYPASQTCNKCWEENQTFCSDGTTGFDKEGRACRILDQGEVGKYRRKEFSDGSSGRIMWKVCPFVDDVELEAVMQKWYDEGFTVRHIWRNSPNKANMETTTIAFSKKERT